MVHPPGTYLHHPQGAGPHRVGALPARLDDLHRDHAARQLPHQRRAYCHLHPPLLTFALLTIGELGPSNTWHQIGGWTGVATAIAAWYTALAGVLRSTFKRQILPVFPT